MSQYIRDHWGADKGFPRGPVHTIAQTNDGYLWIGTEEGLIRFDGLNFLNVKDPAGVYNITGVLGLASDPDGSLWVRLHGSTLLRFRNGVFENLVNEEWRYANISAMAVSSHGYPLISRMEIGAIIFKQGQPEMVAAATALPRSPVISIAQTRDGDIWMGTRDTGVYRVSSEQTFPVLKGLPDSKVNCLLPDGLGNV